MPSLSELSEKDRQLAFERYKIILPYFDDGTKIIEIEKTSGILKRTLYRWVKAQ